MTGPPESLGADRLLVVRNLKKYFRSTTGRLFHGKTNDVKAVDDVSFFVHRGETLGLVGESGSGKSTVGRSVLQVVRPSSGEVYYDGIDLCRLGDAQLAPVRRRMQMIFQDPYSSLNPRMTVGSIIGEPLIIHGLAQSRHERNARVAELLEVVGLSSGAAELYPHEFSGGQRQRISIARALAVSPEFIVADEPVSALDVSIQAQIITLLEDLQAKFGLTYLFISHNLAVIRHISDRVAVMYLGKLMEVADCDRLYQKPLHPYTKSLLSAAPIPDPQVEARRERIILRGERPSPANPPPGCVFHLRCPDAVKECRETVPPLRELETGHHVACIRA